jgi:hypothetical protein
MPRRKAALLLLAFISACLSPCTLAAAAAEGGGKPLVTAVSKDPATLLYTSPLKDSRALVLDLAAPLIWTVTTDGHTRTTTTLSANATDGKNPLYPVSFSAVTSCAPRSLLAKLPAGAVGVAGLGSSRLSLPGQVARTQKLPNKFLLCLPRSGGGGVTDGDGVAIFGGARPVLHAEIRRLARAGAGPHDGPDAHLARRQETQLRLRSPREGHRRGRGAAPSPRRRRARHRRRRVQHEGAVHRAPGRRVPAVRARARRGVGTGRLQGARSGAVRALLQLELPAQHADRPPPPSIDQDGQNYTIAGLDST